MTINEIIELSILKQEVDNWQEVARDRKQMHDYALKRIKELEEELRYVNLNLSTPHTRRNIKARIEKILTK